MMKKILFFFAVFLSTSVLSFNNFVLISAPGSGKGTFSQYLVAKYGYRQICLGDIFRDEIKQNTPLGKYIKPIVESNSYVPENIVCELVKERVLECKTNNHKFIIDGFPRSEHALNFLLELLDKDGNTLFLKLEVGDDICLERILHRLVCTNCFEVFNIKFASPKKENICDTCCNKLSERSLDRSRQIIKDRLSYFHNNTEKLIDLVSEKCRLLKIDANQEISKLFSIYDSIVEKNHVEN